MSPSTAVYRRPLTREKSSSSEDQLDTVQTSPRLGVEDARARRRVATALSCLQFSMVSEVIQHYNAYTARPLGAKDMPENRALTQGRRRELVTVYRDGLLNDTLPFWARHAVDREHGGFQFCLDRDGSVLDNDKGMWQHGRFVWLLSTLCLLYTSPSPRDGLLSRMPSSA